MCAAQNLRRLGCYRETGLSQSIKHWHVCRLILAGKELNKVGGYINTLSAAMGVVLSHNFFLEIRSDKKLTNTLQAHVLHFFTELSETANDSLQEHTPGPK